MQRYRYGILLVIAGLIAGSVAGCSLLMEFDLCKSDEDCHVYERDHALVCEEGNCVTARCHSPSDCPDETYTCRNQRCYHRDDGAHGADAGHDADAVHGDAARGDDTADSSGTI